MTPSFIGRYAVISSGVRPIISFASLPTAKIRLSRKDTATTEGSLSTMPRPGTNTRTVVVPRSIPNFGLNENAIARALYRTAPLLQNLRLSQIFSIVLVLFGVQQPPEFL